MEEDEAKIKKAKSIYIHQTNINKDNKELKAGSALLNFIETNFQETLHHQQSYPGHGHKIIELP
jgi:hypothetical protein